MARKTVNAESGGRRSMIVVSRAQEYRNSRGEGRESQLDMPRAGGGHRCVRVGRSTALLRRAVRTVQPNAISLFLPLPRGRVAVQWSSTKRLESLPSP